MRRAQSSGLSPLDYEPRGVLFAAKRSVTRYQNVMGAVVNGKTMTWQRGRSYLMVREYASKLTESNIVLVDVKLDAVVQKLERAAEVRDNKRLIE
jgi:hypothetical protein